VQKPLSDVNPPIFPFSPAVSNSKANIPISNSGKSSLISTLVQLLDISSGTVLIDELDLTAIPSDTLRQRLFVIPQDPLILSGTLRLNLDPHATATDAALHAALRRVGLHDLLAASRGLDAEMTASALSAGQQQLLALARLLLKQGAEKKGRAGGVLLLDEATSNVDREAEEVLQRVVKEEFAGYTVVAVAHRLETILDADNVVVMDAGRVVEVGPPQVLVENGGWFAGLVGAGTGAGLVKRPNQE
jgi:ATP-binding cassette, subfamily C (CFTR/MRP), member 1